MRARQYFTRGFARAIGLGALVLLATTVVAAVALWSSFDDFARREYALAGVACATATAAGVLAAFRLPRHPVSFEGMRNGAIAGLGVVGVAYLAVLILTYVAGGGEGPLQLDAFAAFFLGWLLPMGVAAAVAGAITGRLRSRSV